jgi:SAM-dependent methyltransferase
VRYWNDQGGPRWVTQQPDLDAQLAPLGAAAIDRLAVASGERVLDVGCGSGATTLAIAERVRSGAVVGVDISAPLLALARERAAGVAHVEFVEADAQIHRFDGPAFDAVFSRFGVMFFADPVAAFRNLCGALRPGGRLGFVCWREMRANPWVTVPLAAGLPHLPEPPAPPEPGAPGPFAFADGDRTAALLARAGFTDVQVVAHDDDLVMAGGDLDRAADLALVVGPLARAMTSIDDAARAKIRGAVRDAFAAYQRPAGVTFPAATWLVNARRPA